MKEDEVLEPAPLNNDQIKALFESEQFDEIQSHMEAGDDAEVADLINSLPNDLQPQMFSLLPIERAASITTYFSQELRERLCSQLLDDDLLKILEAMEPDDRRFILDVVEPQRGADLIAGMIPRQRQETELLLSYPEESVGRLTTPHYLRIRPDWTMNKVLDHIRRYGSKAETLQVLYVIDHEGKLVDDIALRQIMLAPEKETVAHLMDHECVSVPVLADQEEAVRIMDRHDMAVLPVVDEDHKLLGIVTFDDVMDVAQEEASEDIEKLGAMEALGDRYSSVSILKLFRKRVIWLAILFLGGILTILAMGSFHAKIEKNAILALFIPLIIASGGNTGTQTASLMIRALALNDLAAKDWLKVLGRELTSGLLLGVVLGSLGFLVALSATQYFSSDQNPWILGAAIGTAVAAVVLCGAFVGSMLPFLFETLGVDPATSSTPAVATILDVMGLVVYFSVTNLILSP